MSGSNPNWALDALEPRRLLSGVTVIAHGFDSSSTRPAWLDTMAQAIVAKQGGDASVYALRVNINASNVPFVEYFHLLSGPGVSTSTSGEAVVLIDWAAASGVLSNYNSTSSIASLIEPYFLTSQLSIGISAPLVEAPIHLIGHSRGASLMSELANDFGKEGIWVDQETSLDPYPVLSDPAVSLGANVLFADNYYQNSDAFIQGSAVAGAHNLDPLSLPGGNSGVSADHSDVHTYYHGTIDTAAGASDGAVSPIPATWYNGAQGPRTSVGFAWSLIGAAARPADGVGTPFGGSAARVAVVPNANPQWPNVGTISLLNSPTSTLTIGQPAAFSYRSVDPDTADTINWFADPDGNPYNGNSILLPGTQNVALTATIRQSVYGASTADVPAGSYFIYARVNDGLHTRRSYLAGKLTFTASAVTLPFYDLASSGIAMRGTSLNRAALQDAVIAQVASSRGSSNFWLNAGVGSSTAHNDIALGKSTAVGVLLNDNGAGQPLYTSFLGQTADVNTVLARYTYAGDLNLDGQVNADDTSLLIGGINDISKPRIWSNGDLNYDHAINADDVSLFIAGFSSFSSAGPLASVPADGSAAAALSAADPVFISPADAQGSVAQHSAPADAQTPAAQQAGPGAQASLFSSAPISPDAGLLSEDAPVFA